MRNAQALSVSGYGSLIRLRPLQRVAETLTEVAGGRRPDAAYRRKAIRRARTAGEGCIPMLVRALRSADVELSRWAAFLLGRLGGGRVVRELHAVVADPNAPDAPKLLSLMMLGDLGAPPPPEVKLHSPEAAIRQSVRDLLSGLRTRVDIEQAAELAIVQVGSPELAAFCEEMLRFGGVRGRKLVEAISSRAEPEARSEIEGVLAQAREIRAQTAREQKTLEGALELIERGDLRKALPRLERFTRRHPEHPDARSAAGFCLLSLGRPTEALPHFDAAARAEPKVALHHWNVAAAAQKIGRMGHCYLALKSYLELSDEDSGSEERLADAEGFVADYECGVRERHPGTEPARLAQGEEIFSLASQLLRAGRPEEAALELERVLVLVPQHYPAWGALGQAYLAMGFSDQAVECLRRAIEIHPNYEPALRELEALPEP